MDSRETIFALASGAQRAGVAVVRVSGANALSSLEKLTGKKDLAPRMAVLTDIGGFDRGVVIFFKNPASFTGEDVVEYHLHGGRAVIDALLLALGTEKNHRLAEPGEFTRRAFENGKMDLTEAEAVADLIDAETDAQRQQAFAQLGGALAVIYQGWTDRLSALLAHLEADIEFPDEGIEAAIDFTSVDALLKDIHAHLDDNRRGERLREGLKIAIIGAPNAGKSSLLNALAQRDAAIVSDEAGTTRDIIDVHLNLGGYPVILTDTAGIRETDQKIEAEGIRRAKQAAANADIKIALFDGTEAALDADTSKLIDKNTMVVFSKADVAAETLKHCHADGIEQFSLSAKTGEGMDVFLKSLTEKARGYFGDPSVPSLTRARHREALEEAVAALTRALSAALPELAAEDLRLALRALGRITGKVHVEDLLDKIFRDFCIGK